MKSSDPLDEFSNPAISNLLKLSREHEIVFRIHTPTSISPLIWTGALSTSGFCSPDLHLSSLTPFSYKPFYSYSNIIPSTPTSSPSPSPPPIKKKNQPSKEIKYISNKYEISPGPYLRHTVVDHIMNKSKQTCINELPTIEVVKNGVWNDERTPWISTSENLFWSIWEIVRKLSVNEGNLGWVGGVELSIIRHPNSITRQGNEDNIDEREEEGILNATSTKLKTPPSEIWLRPTNVLNPTTYPGELSVSLKEQYEASRKAASSSGELLFFGRIWAENVLCNLEWTREKTPFELPSYLFHTSEENDSLHHDLGYNSKHWKSDEKNTHKQSRIDKLIWDPRSDEYLTAYRKVMDKRKNEAGGRMIIQPDGPL